MKNKELANTVEDLIIEVPKQLKKLVEKVDLLEEENDELAQENKKLLGFCRRMFDSLGLWGAPTDANVSEEREVELNALWSLENELRLILNE